MHPQTTTSPARDSATAPAKRVLVVQYSQSGQLRAVVDSVLGPLEDAARAGALTLRRETLRPLPEFPYPWPFWQFLDTFPETVAGIAPPLAPLTLSAGDRAAGFDLVILAYPVWFLSPPPPITAFLKSDDARALLRGKPVVTLTACRNMWIMAQEKIKKLLADLGSRHTDHIALTDQGNAFATFVTTPRWMFTGRKNSFWGLPPAGVSENQIHAAARFGAALRGALARDAELAGAPMLAGLGACRVDTRLIASERIGTRSFRIWGKLLRALGRPGAAARRAALFAYMLFLVTMIVTVVPLSMLIKWLLRALLREKLRLARLRYEQPSGSGTERLAAFSETKTPPPAAPQRSASPLPPAACPTTST